MSFLHNLDPRWLEAQYRLWQQSPEAVAPSWRAFFEGFVLAASAGPLAAAPAHKQSAVDALIYRYRDIGHLLSCGDPLHACPVEHPLLSLEAFGLGREDLDRTFHPHRFPLEQATLREVVDLLKTTYCRSLGVEYMQIQDPEERHWLRDRMEPCRNQPDCSPQQQLRILEKLLEAALFERFLHRKFLGQKRFSLEGAEVVIPALDHLVQRAADHGIAAIVLGTTHRGRLNILANVLGKPLETIFGEFQDNIDLGFVGEGDVKYHKGFSNTLRLDGGQEIHLTLASNPSHLESVDPVVEGKCRARQDDYGPEGSGRVLPLLIHGDAAFAGQGIVPETLNLSQLEGFGTGGTLHLIINNQIGFTTSPKDSRSTRYATDVAKMLMVPIFHVNGDDPESVLHAAELALDYRQRFGRDVVLEIICYRRQGHNEGDEPYFTQPLMYERIEDHQPVDRLYAERLRESGVGPEKIEEFEERINRRLEEAAERQGEPADLGFSGKWSDIRRGYEAEEPDTAVTEERLQELGRKITAIPEDFRAHEKIRKLFGRHRKAVEQQEEIDWPLAESLAFASLLHEGHTVRMSGQDSRRGTFNQRHSTLYDVESGETFVPLDTVAREGAAFRIFDSTLAEASVLGFEYGYSLESPQALVVWEAQFGDFVNGAQVIIDQFIASSESKWDRASGLVLFLPHGYEGQGPEHSSSRIERFLQLCADDNLQVVFPSTPAQFFHLLRRQLKRSFRRPLVVFTPKSLLRLPACRSPWKAFHSDRFREILPDQVEAGEVRKVLLCSGKIFFELDKRRREEERRDLAIIRVEQLHPLRTDLLEKAVAPYESAESYAWVQEEPRNMGAWSFLKPCLQQVLGSEPRYVGRDAAATPAVGSHRLHQQEQEQLIEDAFRR